MKNKITFIFLIFFLSFNVNSYGEEFTFETTEIRILDDGNKIEGIKGTKATTSDGIEIISDKFLYDKVNQILVSKGNVQLTDKLNNIVLKTNKLSYFRDKEIIFSHNSTKIDFDNIYLVDSNDVTYDREALTISSNKDTKINDSFNNFLTLKNLNFFLKTKVVKGKEIFLIDSEKNKYHLEQGFFDLKNKKILAKDVEINFENSILGNSENEPRLKGKSLKSDKKKSIISKGVFTTCKRNDDCPPWSMFAEEITHDKSKKTIYYKNAWLKVYDKPVLYFPKFFHPDPSIKRRSGFLTPQIVNSSVSGSSFVTPYFHAISGSKDLTFTPRIYLDKSMILQTEYRQANKNSFHLADFSINKKSLSGNELDGTETHFFSNSKFELDLKNFEETNFELNIQQVSNDTFLKVHKLKSPLIEENSILHSFANFNTYGEDLSIETSLEVYEDLNKDRSNRFEYVYPDYNIVKNLNGIINVNGDLNFEFNGYQKKSNTNTYNLFSINNLIYNSSPLHSAMGLKTNYDMLLKNVNYNQKNIVGSKDKERNGLLSSFRIKSSFPLKKEGDIYDGYLTPKISLMYSPNKTQDIKNKDRRTDINNIFSFNRIGSSTGVEGGQSLTIGSDYTIKNKDNKNDLLNLGLGTVFRDKKNHDLPTKSTIGEKSSDVVGSLNIKPIKFIDFNYNFSLDNSLNGSNYDLINTKFKLNNFVTSFEFLEEKNALGSESYLSNETTYNFDNTNSLSFKTRENKKTNLTEYYNLIYEYKNDCLVAGIEYNKEYYTDTDLKPEEQLFFSITIIPFGKTNAPNLKQ